jgi:hypothetical protein
MTARPRRTTTLVGPNRIVLGAATAGLVALASAGTALLVLTGTSSVAPVAAPAPPLPSSSPLTRAPGVVILPSDEAGRLTGGTGREAHARKPALVFRAPAVAAAPVALAFTDVPAVAPPAVPARPRPVAAPPAPPAAPAAPERPALRREPAEDDDNAGPAASRPGRHLAKGHAKHHAKKARHHGGDGEHAGWEGKRESTHAQHHVKHAQHHGERRSRSHADHGDDG